MSYRNGYYDRRAGSVYLRTWDEEGNRITEKHAFKPYMYVETAGTPDGVSLYQTPVKKLEFDNINGRHDYVKKYNITRSFEQLPPQQQFLVDMFWKSNETDDFSKNPLRFSFVDIEVEAKGFPFPVDAKYPVSLITVYDSLKKVYHVFSFKKGNIDFTKDGLEKETIKYYPFDGEKLMLLSFIRFMVAFDFDIISGWNSDNFDIPYLVNRIRKILGEKELLKLSPYLDIQERDAETKFGVPIKKYIFAGVSSIDYLDAYKKFNMNIKESYKLDFIAKAEKLGISKIDYGDQSIYDFQTKEWERFVRYNVIDVRILVKLEEKLQYIALLRQLAYTGLCNIEEALKTVPLVNGAVAVKARHKGMLMPTFVRPHREGKNIGAYVAPPRKGFVKSLLTFDATSLYPSTIMSMNLSPETKIGKVISEENGNVTFETIDGKVMEINSDKFAAFLQSQNLVLTKYKTVFRQDEKGIIPEILEKFFTERQSLKGMMKKEKQKKVDAETAGDMATALEHGAKERYYDTKQNAVKVFMNSMYGYMGNKHAPMGDDDIANSITLTCQYLIKNTGRYSYDWVVRESGKQPKYEDVMIYGDTDSVHICVDEVLKARNHSILSAGSDHAVDPKVFNILDEMRVYINDEIGKWAKDELGCAVSKFEFKAEKICWGGIYNEKKKYCLHTFWDEGVVLDEFKYTGLDVVKSTMPAVIKPMAKKLTEFMIESQVKANVDTILYDVEKKVKTLNVEEIAFVSGIKKVEEAAAKSRALRRPGSNAIPTVKGAPFHVKAAIAYNQIIEELGLVGRYEPIMSGDKIRIIYVKKPNRYNIDAIAFKGKYPKEFDAIFQCDMDKMYEKAMFSYANRLYTSVQWPIYKANMRPRLDVMSMLTGGKPIPEAEADELADIYDPDEDVVVAEEENFNPNS